MNLTQPLHSQPAAWRGVRSRSTLLAASLLAAAGLIAWQSAPAQIPLPVTHWLGNTSNLWTGPNWALDAAGTPTIDVPGATSDITFSAAGATNQDTVLGMDFTIRSLTVNDVISISGANMLTVTADTLVNNGSLTINAGVTVAGTQNTIASYVGTTGTVTVGGTDARWTATGDLNVGFEGGSAGLRVENGGLVSADSTKIGGYVSSTNNTVVVSGSGSQLNNTTNLTVGYGGDGNQLTVEAGATVTNLNSFIGHRLDAASSSNFNTATVTGAGSLWTSTGTFYLGDYGTNNALNLADGGKVSVVEAAQDMVVGNTVGSTGNSLTVTGSGSEFANDATFYLGKAGGGNTLMVEQGGLMTTRNARIGGDATSSGNMATVTGAGSNWNISGTALRVGSLGSSNSLSILDGGTVTVDTGRTFVGYGAGSNNNSILVSGTGSSLSVWDLFVGRLGTNNTVTVAAGGLLLADNIILGEQAGSSGTLQIGTGGLAGTVTAFGVGSGAGTGTVNFDHTDDIVFSSFITGDVTVNKNGTGITVLTGLFDYTGTTNVNAGVLSLQGALFDGGDVTVAVGAVLSGGGIVAPEVDSSIRINGGIQVDGFIPFLQLDTAGTGSTVMGPGSFIALDLLGGAGNGSNLFDPGAAETLQIVGQFDVSAGTTLFVGNPTGMTGFAIGDEWQLLAYCGCFPVVGEIGLNDSAVGLPLGLAGRFDTVTGIYSIVDVRPQVSAQTGLQTANAQDQALMTEIQGLLSDINGRLFNLRAGRGEEDGLAASMDEGVITGEGDGPEGPVGRRVLRSREWETYVTVNYGNISLSSIGTQSGVDSQSWSPGVGIERHVSRHWAIGFAASLLQAHQTYGNNLGSLEIEGVAFSAYASYVRGPFWGDVLYNFGRFDLESDRNPGFAFPMAQGETKAWTNAVQFNTGWNFRFQNNTLVTGPFAGVDYLHIAVDSYTENGGGAAALAYASRDVDSLITRVGWSVSKRIDTDFATITPQLRVSYERQNISNNNGTSVSLINLPFTASSNAQSPGQDYLVAGAGVNFQFTPVLSLMLNYQGQFFRQNLQAHYAGLRLSYKF